MTSTSRRARSKAPKRLAPVRGESNPLSDATSHENTQPGPTAFCASRPTGVTFNFNSSQLPPLPNTTYRPRSGSDPHRARSAERELLTSTERLLIRAQSQPRRQTERDDKGNWYSKGDAVKVLSGDNAGRLGEVSRWEPNRRKWLVRLQQASGKFKLYWISSERLAPAYGTSDKADSASEVSPELPPVTPTGVPGLPDLQLVDVEGLSRTELKKQLSTRGAQSKGLRSKLVRILKKILKEGGPREEGSVPSSGRASKRGPLQSPNRGHKRNGSMPTPKMRRLTPPALTRPPMLRGQRSVPVEADRLPVPGEAHSKSSPQITAKARRQVSRMSGLSGQASKLEKLAGQLFTQSKLTLHLTSGPQDQPASPESAGELEEQPDTEPISRENTRSVSPRSLNSTNLREHRRQFEPRSHLMLRRFLREELSERPVQARQRLLMKLKTSYQLLKRADYQSHAVNQALRSFGKDDKGTPRDEDLPALPDSPDRGPQRIEIALDPPPLVPPLIPLDRPDSPRDSGASEPRSPGGLVITTRDVRLQLPDAILRTPSPI